MIMLFRVRCRVEIQAVRGGHRNSNYCDIVYRQGMNPFEGVVTGAALKDGLRLGKRAISTPRMRACVVQESA